MLEQNLIDHAFRYGIEITTKQATLLLQNMSLVLSYNQRTNLTAITNEESFIDKHLMDSLLCPKLDCKRELKIIDVGTGGGFPGIPLAILYPMHQFTLLDATAKKLRIVQDIAEKLQLKNVNFLEGRAEVLSHHLTKREKFDIALSRGVAAYPILAELCTPFVKKGGKFMAWKGPNYENELSASKNALEILKMRIIEIKKENLLKTDGFHVIIVSEKTGNISNPYPRNFGAIKKRPL